MVKRTFDIIGSALGILLFSPVILTLGVLVKLGSQGPIFYQGLRSGRKGMSFRIFKFRSMVTNAEQLGGPSTSDEDPRVTTTGKFMRKFKLDELPQLFNVLRGEMSLVGPRPQVSDYVARYSDEERLVLKVRPGITDWASIWNSDEGAVLAAHADPDRAYDELIHPTKMKLQLLYARNSSLWVDVKILTYTLFGLIRRGWVPAEIRSFPKPGEMVADVSVEETCGYETVTELPGAPVNTEQLKMLDTRYGWAGELAAGKEVLEVACGSGIGLGHLAAHAKRVVGGDYDPKIAEIARQQYDGKIEVRQMDAQSLPFEDASFDMVMLFEAIYYLQNPVQFVQEACRVLRPGGSLLICSANCERPDFNVSPFSHRYLSASSLRQLLESHGFQTTIYAGFLTESQGAGDRIRQGCREVAVKLKLIPKTMKWKARFKRLFFGKLKSLPAKLGPELNGQEPLVEVDSIDAVSDYKVLYALGERKAVETRVAA